MLDKAYHQKLLENKQSAKERTAKKRAKRLKKKNKRLKHMKEASSDVQLKNESDSSDSESDRRK